MNATDKATYAPSEEGVELVSVSHEPLKQVIYRFTNELGDRREALISRLKGDRLWKIFGAVNREPTARFPLRLCDDLPLRKAIEQACDYVRHP